jgi:hypothetical protein
MFPPEKRFLRQDCVIEHRFVSGERHREHKVDGRRQGELYSKRYRAFYQKYLQDMELDDDT